MLEKRIEKLRELLEDRTAILITSDINRRYLTGLNSSAGSVIITPKRALLLIDFRYFERAKATVFHMEVQLCQKTLEDTAKILKEDGIKHVLTETKSITLSAFNSLKSTLTDFNFKCEDTLSLQFEALRCIKSEEEIEFIKAAQAITDSAFAHILNFIKAGTTERDIALELEYFMGKKGSEGVAFDTIAVSGKNSSLPHGVPGQKPLEKGDFLTLDFGAKYMGYCSDMTRTVAIGHICEKQRLVYDTVLQAQGLALEFISAGKKCCDVDKIARNAINSAGFEGAFGHGLGHSLGLEIHENPACNTRDNTLLKAGMIMTVEPGIYLENEFGVRIEDMVLITESGAQNLTHSPKELIIL